MKTALLAPAPRARLCSYALLAGRAQLLGPLEHLTFGLDGRGDDELSLLELLDALRADRAHACPDRPDEIERAVLGERGTEEDLLERPRDSHADARPPRQVRVRRRHAPVIATTWRFLGARERGADHDGIGTRGEGLADVSSARHAAVGDDRDISPRALVVEVPRRGGVCGGRHLGDAEPEHLAARARGPRPDTDEH